jgi:transposase InsO family protein
MRFDFIEAEKARYPVLILCEALEVSRSGFYARRGRSPSKRQREDQRLAPAVQAVFLSSGKTYGSPRIHKELTEGGEPISRRRTCRLMKDLDLVARKKRPFVTTTMSEHDNPIAPNLLRRDFVAAGPHQKLVGDITYLPTAEGFIYLAILLDLYSRRIVGYAVGATLETSLALRALDMAISTRALNAGTIHHTDRGVQYSSAEYVQRLETKSIVRSMSRTGNCWDNAPAESFFSSFKFEVGELLNGLAPPQDVRRAVLDYIAFYNLKRRHSSIGYASPAEFERDGVQLMKAVA